MPSRRTARIDAGSRRSAWVEIPCSTCGSRVSRRKSEAPTRGRIYCTRKCYRDQASEHAHWRKSQGEILGRPRSTETRTVKTSDGFKAAYKCDDGYIRVYWPEHPSANKRGSIMEHRAVMEKMLGRVLFPDEKVHHKNGKRDDNRKANLELWSVAHPSGQRVDDKVAFALEMLHRYAPEHLLLKRKKG